MLTINLSVITLTFLNDEELVATLDSIQIQKVYPIVIVKDGVLRCRPSFLDTYTFEIHYISSKDHGIYHAMNQALNFVETDFVTFLNSGDCFFSENSLKSIQEILSNAEYSSYDVFLCPWVYQGVTHLNTHNPSLHPFRFNHQAVIYKPSLHILHGTYSILRFFTASDYMFFLSIYSHNPSSFACLKNIPPIASVDANGVSSSLRTPALVASLEFFASMSSRMHLLAVLLLHPLYFFFRRRLMHFLFSLLP